MELVTAPTTPVARSWMVALRDRWPEYLIEAWALGMFMVSASLVTTALEYPGSPLREAIADADLRRAVIGLAMGLTAIALIYSPWGQRSGAHMNPAVTLTYLRLGRIRPVDAGWYVGAQLLGGLAGVLVAHLALGAALADPPVEFAVTRPGPAGAVPALAAELCISTLLMAVVLGVSSRPDRARWTGVCAGVLVATFIIVEAPLSGMSMNPARSFASALPAASWSGFWIYLVAPVAGMQLAAAWHRWRGRASPCAKLVHGTRQRCIHCGYEPARHLGELP